MVEVNADNFESVLSELTSIVPEAAYVAIDTEFTGLGKRFETVTIFDNMEQRYQKMKTIVQRYSVIQFGLSVFNVLGEDRLECQTFTFYTFPSAANVDFVVSVPTATFLIRNQFSFDKLIQTGLHYMKKKEEIAYREKLDKVEELEPVTDISEKDTQFLEATKAIIDDWVEKGATNPHITQELSPFRRRLVYQLLRESYPFIWAENTRNSGNSPLILIHIGSNEESIIQSFRDKKKEEKIDKAIGFRKVIDLLALSKVPIVGHNMLLDLLFIYEHYLESLPATYLEFRRSILDLFPILIDTKFIAEFFVDPSRPLTSTVLQDLFVELKRFPEVVKIKSISSGTHPYTPEKLRPHNAGYDSWMTGCVFAHLCHREFIPFDTISTETRIINQIYLTTGQKHLNLNSEDNEAIFYLPENTFVVQGNNVGEGFHVVNLLKKRYGSCISKKLSSHEIMVIIPNLENLESWEEYRVVRLEKHKKMGQWGLMFGSGIGLLVFLGVFLAYETEMGRNSF